jgi:hypothetical protein
MGLARLGSVSGNGSGEKGGEKRNERIHGSSTRLEKNGRGPEATAHGQ